MRLDQRCDKESLIDLLYSEHAQVQFLNFLSGFRVGKLVQELGKHFLEVGKLIQRVQRGSTSQYLQIGVQ